MYIYICVCVCVRACVCATIFLTQNRIKQDKDQDPEFHVTNFFFLIEFNRIKACWCWCWHTWGWMYLYIWECIYVCVFVCMVWLKIHQIWNIVLSDTIYTSDLKVLIAQSKKEFIISLFWRYLSGLRSNILFTKRIFYRNSTQVKKIYWLMYVITHCHPLNNHTHTHTHTHKQTHALKYTGTQIHTHTHTHVYIYIYWPVYWIYISINVKGSMSDEVRPLFGQ